MGTNGNGNGNGGDVVQVQVSKSALKALLRLDSLKAEGVYELVLIVRPRGERELVVKNPGQPHALEHLGR